MEVKRSACSTCEKAGVAGGNIPRRNVCRIKAELGCDASECTVCVPKLSVSSFIDPPNWIMGMLLELPQSTKSF